MSTNQAEFPTFLKRSRPLQVGFIPDGDCAPLVAARESGLFEKYELSVELQRRTRWANIRDEMIEGDLDAAHAPASLPFVVNFGIDSDPCACVAAMVLSLQGNAITISRELWDQGVRDGATLREQVFRNWGRRTYAFGVVFPHSPAYFLLRQWLKAGGILPHREVRIVVVPPAQMYPTLKLGYIDGYCVSEPWTSLALDAQVGACVATSADLAPGHPEKVLMVRSDFARQRVSEHEHLVAALLEACAFCDQPKNHGLLGEMLSRPHYVDAPADCLQRGLSGGADPRSGGSSIFFRNHANDPTDQKALWLMDRLYELMEHSVLKPPAMGRTPVIKNVFRRDVFEAARSAVWKQVRALQAEAENYEARAK